MRFVDPEPFEPSLPASVGVLIEQARAGEGPAAVWLRNRQGGWGPVSDGFGFLRGHPVQLEPVQVGWLVGITMFCDDLNALVDVIERERHRAPIPYVIQAFVAGILAGVEPVKRQWKSIERLTDLGGEVPTCLLEVLPIGVISDRALERGVALRLARALGEPAVRVLEQTLAETTGKKHSRRLSEALEQLAGQPTANAVSDGTLTSLLDAWRATKNPDLAAAIAFFGRSTHAEPLQARSKSELEGAWLALGDSQNPADLERLLRTPWPGAWKLAKKRIEALARFPADPRIAAALMDAVRRYPSQGSFPMHQALIRVVAAIGDGRHAEAASNAAEQRWANRNDYQRLAEHLASIEPLPVPSEVRELVASLLQQRDELQQLWAAVWEEPGDDQRRLVLADALQSLGDPRGEFILCQLAEADGGANAAVRKRIKALLAANIDAWTGPIPDVKRASRKFEKGFVSALTFGMPSGGGEALAQLPAWRTVTHLNVPSGGGHLDPILRRAGCLQSLLVGYYTIDHFDDLGPYPGVQIIGVAESAAQRFPAFPDLRVVLARSFSRYDSQPAVIAEEVLKAFALGHDVGLVRALDARKNQRLLARLGPRPQGRLTLFQPTGRRDDDPLFDKGWRLQVGPEAARLGWVGGSSWKVDEAVERLGWLAKAGCKQVTVHLAGAKKKRAELQAASPVALVFAANPFAL